MGKSIRITGVWLLVLAFYMPLMAQKNIAVASAAILLEKVKPAETKGSLKGLLPDLMEDDNQVLVVAQVVK